MSFDLATPTPDWHPLSAIQRSLWILYRMQPEQRSLYNIALAARATPAIAPDALQRALDALVARHAMLRTCYAEIDGVPMQRCVAAATVPVQVFEVDTLAEDALRTTVEADRARAFDLGAAPLLRASLYRAPGDDGCVMLLTVDHLACDAWSFWQVLEELGALLVAERGGEPPVFEPAPTFFEHVAQQREWLSSAPGERQFAHWREALAEPAPPLDLPRLGGEADGDARDNVTLTLDRELTASLNALAQRHNSSMFAVQLAAYMLLLHRLSGQTRIAIGSPMPARGARWGRTIGNFTNPVVLQAELDVDGDVSALLRQLQSQAFRALKYQQYPLSELVERLNPARGAYGQPYFQALFVSQKARAAADTMGLMAHSKAIGQVAWGGVQLSAFGRVQNNGGVGMDLLLETAEVGEQLIGALEFDGSKYSRADAERMVGYLRNLLAAMADDDTQPLSRLQMLGDAERESLLIDRNGAHRALPPVRGAHELFEARVREMPQAPAVCIGGDAISYDTLNRRANRLARHLVALGAKPDARVALCAARGPAMLTGLLAIWKAAGAYLPLDPAYPADRLAWMVEDGAPCVVLCDAASQAAAAPHVPAGVPLLVLDADAAEWQHLADDDLDAAALGLGADHLAYVIYTSGSTGRPKGVMVEHRGLVNYALDAVQWFGLVASDTVLQQNSLNFDLSLEEIVPAWAAGAAIVPSVLPFGSGAAIEERCSMLHLTAAHWHALVGEWQRDPAAARAQLDGVRIVNVTGDALAPQKLAQWESLGLTTTLINTYGPTEITVSCSAAYPRHEPGSTRVSIGRPFSNTRLYLLDARGEPVPTGAVGELCIAGAGVARGYLNRPDLTAERFASDPFVPAERMYKSGDLARWRTDGELEFVGRNDFQVKLRGFRVEPGEIETVLLAQPGVRDAVVLVRKDLGDQPKLVAYVVGDAALDALRTQVAAVLPAYMQLDAYVALDALPRTPGGKLDRRALPAPAAIDAPAFEAPEGDMEARIAALWAELLQVERVGRADNFFVLGGHSLLAVSLVERLRRAGLKADMRALFATPTLAAFAAGVVAVEAAVVVPANRIPQDATAITPEMLPLVALDAASIERIVAQVPGGAANVQDIYPLAPLQEGILFHHLMAEEGDPYLSPMLLRFDSRERLDGFVAAVRQVIARHDILRTAIVWQQLAAPVQVVLRRAELAVDEPVLDAADGDIGAQLEARYDPRRLRLDLTQAPLMRWAAAAEAGSGRWLLRVLAHHLVLDQSALALLIEEARTIEEGGIATLPAPSPFRDFVARARMAFSEAEHEAYFRGRLVDIDEPTAPYGLLDVQGDGRAVRGARQRIDGAYAARVREVARRRGVGAASLMHLAWALVAARTTGRRDVVFGTVLSGRLQGDAQAERVMGLFINTLPLRLSVDETATAAALAATQAALAELLRHEHASLALAQRCSGVEAPAPLFTSLLNYRHAASAGDSWDGIDLLSGEERSNYPLSLDVDDLGDAGYVLTAQVREPVDPAELCALMRTAIERLVDALEGDGHEPLSSLDILPAAQRERAVVAWNATAQTWPDARCAHELIAAQAAATPQATALVQGDRTMTYAELDAAADALARRLQGLGVGPDRIVAVCLPRRPEQIVALLAVLKAGGAYVPLDPSYPAERVAMIVADCRPVAVLTGDDVPADVRVALVVASARAGATMPLIDVDAPADADATGPVLVPSHDPRRLAYLIYTSGSTGTPKGVMVEQRGLANQVRGVIRRLGLQAGDRFLQFASASFDVSAQEIFCTLAAGATLVLREDHWLADAATFWSLCDEAGVTLVNLPTLYWEQMAASPAAIPAAVRVLVMGGEAVSERGLATWFARPGHRPRLVNAYGPTETTINATLHEPADASEWRVIGRPVDNAQILLLDAQQRPVPAGAAGELYIGGVNVARGYLNRAELTAERFVDDPFHAGGRLYRTGDLGRHRADGTIEFLGRNDFQVKVRGFRIELGEIEAALCALPGVREAVVVARRHDAGGASGQQLVAYCVAGAGIDAASLTEALARRLPAHMLPSAVLMLAALPVTPSGKVDRRALPAVDLADTDDRYEAPQGPIEAQLALIWGELLKRDRIGRYDDFFRLGGHSLLAVSLIERMRQAGLRADVRALFAHPTLAALAARVHAAEEADVAPPNGIPAEGCDAIEPAMLPLVALSQTQIDAVVATVPGGSANVQDIYPLAPLQEGMLFHHLMGQHGDVYLEPILLAFDDEARVQGWLAALQQVVDRHDILRTALRWEGLPEPVQVVLRRATLNVETLAFEAADDVAEALQNRYDPRHHRVDVREAPLLRAKVARDDANGRWLVLLLVHHLAMDHTALDLVQHEIATIRAGRAAELPVPMPFRTLVAEARHGVPAEAHEAFFREMLGDVAEPTAPYDVLDVQGDGVQLHEVRRPLDDALARRLRAAARALGVSPASLSPVAHAQVLARVTGRDDVVFGTLLFGRLQAGAGADRTLGLFINTLPLRVAVGETGVRAGVRDVHARLVALMRHEHAPLALAQRCSGVAAPLPLFTSLLNYRYGMPARDDGLLDDGIRHLGGRDRTNYPLTVSIDDLGEGYVLTTQAAAPIVPERVTAALETALIALVDALEGAPDTPLRTLDVLPAAERRQLLVDWNDTAHDHPSDRCMHAHVERWARETPDAIALEQGDECWTYRALNEAANRLARHLRARGVARDRRVAVCTVRSAAMVIAQLATWKAGGAYVPLDPAYPAERIGWLLDDAEAVVVLADDAGRAVLPETGREVLDPCADAQRWGHLPAEDLDVADADAEQLAYVIYTSGSTGRPKGVMVEHRQLANLVGWHVRAFELQPGDRSSSTAGVGFDACAWEVWPVLCSGGRLLLAPAAASDAAALLDWWKTQPLDVSFVVTPLVEAAVATGALNPSPRALLTGGDRLHRVPALPAGQALVNNYGPTECTVVATSGLVEADGSSVPHIGRPVDNTRIYLLDERLRLVPVGAAGELWIAGDSVARGYLNRPELTQERFVADPFVAGARMYRSGDLARWREDGTLDYLGRNDFQVKVRGFRIELGEIEVCLASCPGVQEAAVLAPKADNGEARLIACYVGEATADALRRHAAESLPAYMVPSAWVQLDRMPLTAHGKIDRRALPVDAVDATPLADEPPQGEAETAIAAAFAELLRRESVGRHGHFFELGGHSLHAVSLVERLRVAGFGTDVRTLYAAPTPAALAAAIAEAAGRTAVVVPDYVIPADAREITPEMLPLVALDPAAIDAIVARVPGGVANVQDIYPLAPLQEGILFHHLMAGEADPYVLPSLLAFSDRARLDRFLNAVRQVIARHDILRTSIAWQGLASAVQVVQRVAELPVDELALDPQGGPADRQLAACVDARTTRFDLGRAPLLRCTIAEDTANGRWLLQVLAHHIAIDHTTMDVLVREAAVIEQGEADSLPTPAPFRDVVAQARLGMSTAEHEAYFGEMLGDVDEATTPFGLADMERAATAEIAEARDWLDADVANDVRRQARRLGLTPASLMHQAWAMVLARATGRDDVVFGTVLFGRLQGGAQSDRVVGLFINTLPLRLTMSDIGTEAAVRDTHRRLVELMRHEHAPLALAQRCSGVAAPAPLFTSLLNVRHTPQGVDGAALPEGIEELGGSERSSYPLALSIDDTGDRFLLTAQVAGRTHDVRPQRVVAMMQAALTELVHALAQTPAAPIAALDVMPVADRREMLQAWNDTSAAYPRERGLAALLETQARDTPAAIAIVHGERALSYEMLDAQSTRLAHRLRRMGVARGSRVALAFERSIALVVAQLAVLKAGGAYVPLDTAQPLDRLERMVQDSDCRLLLTHAAVTAELPALPTLDVDAADDASIDSDVSALPVSDGASEAYVMYTSGSTGQPKGVAIAQRGVARLAFENRYCSFTPEDRTALAANPAFDATTMEIWAPLLTGGTVVVIDQAVLLDPQRFNAELLAQQVSVLFLTIGLFNQYHREAADAFRALRVLITGGDALDARIMRRVLHDSKPTHLIAAYGPTETTTYAMTHEVVELADDAVGVPLGKPIGHTRVYVLDAQQRPSPIGVTGEICIGGDGVGLGYLNRPELTAERFPLDPFSANGERMYRTGDLARWREDGVLEFMGRNDQQVKIRGFRVELGDIEARLGQLPGVREVVVVVRQEKPGDKRLVAYYTSAEGEALGAEALRAHAAAGLPDYMVPAAYVPLESLPLNANGKLDRKALPAPDEAAYASRAYEAPQGDVETTLAALWAELLDVEQVGRHDNFFELGGHSLLAVSLIERMRRLGLQADVRTLFGAPTVAGLAQSVGAGRRETDIPPNRIPADAERITPDMLPLVELDQRAIDLIVARVPGGTANVQDIYPLAPLQEGILFHHLMTQDGDPYLLPHLLGFASRARLDRFVAALQQVVHRHDILRTAIVWQGLDAPVQVVRRAATMAIDEVAFDPRDGEIAEQLEARYDPRRYRLDLGDAPLLRCMVAADADHGRWLLRILAHHIAIDHTTLDVLLQEARLIEQGRNAELPAAVPFRNFIAQTRMGPTPAEHEAFFTEMLADIDEPTAPFGLVDVQGTGHAIGEAEQMIDGALAQRVRRRARSLGVSAASLMHLAWSLVLARTTGRDDVVFGTVLFGRMHGGADADRVAGVLINTLPLRLTVDDESVEASLKQTHALLARLMRHEHATLALAQRCSGVAAPAPLFSALLNYRHTPPASDEPIEDPADAIDVLSGDERTNYPLAMSVDDYGQDFLLTAQSASPVAPQRVCALMATAIGVLVDALETAPERSLRTLDVLPAEERSQLAQWNATDAAFDLTPCLHELIERQVRRTPEAVALVDDHGSCRYRELDERANRLAQRLRGVGVGPDRRVAVSAERGIPMVVALLATLKAGGAYVPFDPTLPADRLRSMLDDCAPQAVLFDDAGGAALVPLLAEGPACLHLTRDVAESMPAGAVSPAEMGLTPNHLAYVIYTSGSTGKPKGAMNEHRAIVNRLTWMQQAYGLTADDVVLQKTPFSFDVSVWEFFWPLMVGARLVLARPEGHKDPVYLAERIQEAGVTTLHFVPSMLQAFLAEEASSGCTSLKRVICSGEALPASLAQRCLERLPAAELHNLYGPTEAAVDVTAWQCRLGEESVPIGRPIANTRMYVLDEARRPVPVGVAGELWIAGVQVGRGYLNRPELTAERFIDDPFVEGGRMYKTGDVGQWREDGAIEYLGRNDFQVKIRGLRIELGDIEACLVRCEGAGEVVVIAREDQPGDQRLVAYTTGRTDAEALRAHALQSLPQHMVPNAFVRIEALPLNANGKLDRKALPAPEGASQREYEAPQGETETTLAALWSELLKVERVGRNDNFFELGGHSLLAVTLVERMRRAGLQADVRALFGAPTLADLAQAMCREDMRVVVPENLIPEAFAEEEAFEEFRI